MILTLILCAIAVILIYYQIFTQGLFSSMIMAVLSLVSAIVALNYHEMLASLLNDLGMARFGPKGVSLLGIFILTLLLLREGTDRLIKGNMHFGLLIDRVASACFALVSSLTITGMIALGLQSLPLPASFLGFDRCGESLSSPDQDKRLLPYGDNFVLGMMNRVSNHCFAGSSSFTQIHPDMLREMYINRIVPDNFDGMRKEAASDALEVIGDVKVVQNEARDNNNKERIDRQSRSELLLIKVKLKAGTGTRGNRGAKDIDSMIRFSMGQFRLVGYNPAKPHQPGYSVYPIGLREEGNSTTIPKALDKGECRSSRTATFTLVFDRPVNLNEAPLQFLEFKRSSRAKVHLEKK